MGGDAGEIEELTDGVVVELELLGSDAAFLGERVARLREPVIHPYVMLM